MQEIDWDEHILKMDKLREALKREDLPEEFRREIEAFFEKQRRIAKAAQLLLEEMKR